MYAIIYKFWSKDMKNMLIVVSGYKEGTKFWLRHDLILSLYS